MLLTIDIGNTSIMLGVFDEAELKDHWRIKADKERTSDEYGITLSEMLAHKGLSKEDITASAVSCVVPSLSQTFNEALDKYLGARPLMLGPGTKTGMAILTDNPKEVGADRIASAVGAWSIYGQELIVVDFGTAITFDHVSAKGEYLGGAIAPGLSVASNALFTKAARIARVDITRPSSITGKNTVDCVRAGLYFGFVGLVDGIVERMKKTCQKSPRVVATGGDAPLIAKEARTINAIDEFLVLKGLRVIYETNRR
ncbi:Pantothenate kinase type III, CoaX-like [hydrothermal vent metagenome]|uniref:Type III pantothenate kinase n=1 Tax=hydrothermal vent metagenome TaxID=652676 RepID=A0A3B0V1I3_9ZZZZ